MSIVQKTLADIVAMYERTEKMHPTPHFAIVWSFRKPGGDKALLGIIRHDSTMRDGKYAYEVWEVGT